MLLEEIFLEHHLLVEKEQYLFNDIINKILVANPVHDERNNFEILLHQENGLLMECHLIELEKQIRKELEYNFEYILFYLLHGEQKIFGSKCTNTNKKRLFCNITNF